MRSRFAGKILPAVGCEEVLMPVDRQMVGVFRNHEFGRYARVGSYGLKTCTHNSNNSGSKSVRIRFRYLLWRQDFILSKACASWKLAPTWENSHPHLFVATAFHRVILSGKCKLKTCTHRRLERQFFSDRSFLDMLVTLRQASVRQHIFAMAPSGHGSRKRIRLLENAVEKAAYPQPASHRALRPTSMARRKCLPSALVMMPCVGGFV